MLSTKRIQTGTAIHAASGKASEWAAGDLRGWVFGEIGARWRTTELWVHRWEGYRGNKINCYEEAFRILFPSLRWEVYVPQIASGSLLALGGQAGWGWPHVLACPECLLPLCLHEVYSKTPFVQCQRWVRLLCILITVQRNVASKPVRWMLPVLAWGLFNSVPQPQQKSGASWGADIGTSLVSLSLLGTSHRTFPLFNSLFLSVLIKSFTVKRWQWEPAHRWSYTFIARWKSTVTKS